MNKARITGYIIKQDDGDTITISLANLDSPAVKIEDEYSHGVYINAEDWEAVKHAIDSLLTPANEEIAQKETDAFVTALMSQSDRAEAT